jgi:hypothetical protein
VFLDGAVAGCNNPVEVAYNEVKQLLPLHEPKVIISVGTNPKKRRNKPGSKRTKLFLTLGMIRETVKSFKNSVLASERVHLNFMEEHGLSDAADQFAHDDKAMYFRFDVPHTRPFQDVRLGDWKGDQGSTTKNAMIGPTDEYLDDPVTNAKLLRCAQELVKIRRQRVKTARWETFASDARLHYLCPERRSTDNAACRGLRFDSRHHLRQHAFERHGFARRVSCLYHSQMGHVPPQTIEWTCFKDDCQERVLAFDDRTDFSHHFRTDHDRQEPRFIESQDIEKWLDDGREWLSPDDPRRPSRRTTAEW